MMSVESRIKTGFWGVRCLIVREDVALLVTTAMGANMLVGIETANRSGYKPTAKEHLRSCFFG
jgi:hypothetical protein